MELSFDETMLMTFSKVDNIAKIYNFKESEHILHFTDKLVI